MLFLLLLKQGMKEVSVALIFKALISKISSLHITWPKYVAWSH